MYIAIKISMMQKICSKKTFEQIEIIYKKYFLLQKLKKYFKKKEILKSLKYMQNDKKKDDEKINFIFLKRIGKTTNPGENKFKIDQIKKIITKLF